MARRPRAAKLVALSIEARGVRVVRRGALPRLEVEEEEDDAFVVMKARVWWVMVERNEVRQAHQF